MFRLLGAAAIAVAALTIPTGAPAHRQVVVLPAGIDWNSDPRTFRGKNGSRYSFLCPADGKPTTVWGTDLYTDDSSVCSAGVHQGVIKIADGGMVTVEMRPGAASYTGSARNGVTSTSYGAWSSSYVVVGSTPGGGVSGVKMGGAGWSTTAAAHRGHNGSRYRYVCPSGGTYASVWGTNIYTDDSSVCTAAAHVGVITAAAGGNVTIETRPGQRSYVSFAHNGITTRAYGSWTGSFVLSGAAPIPGSPGGGGGGGTTTTTTPGGGAAPPPTATATGTVLVNGQPFTSGTIPYGATVDVTNGTVLLRADTGTLTVNGAGGISAVFVLVRATDKKRPIVELRLTRGNFSVCPARKKNSGSQTPSTTVRQLWGNGKGRFRTRGRYAAATVRGTNWLTADRCNGTFVRVRQGVIGVLDPPRRQEITLRAPRTYLARP